MLDIYTRIMAAVGNNTPQQKQRERLMNEISLILNDYDYTPKTRDLVVYERDDMEAVKTFIGVKKVEGRTDGTLRTYLQGLRMLKTMVNGKNLLKLTTNEIRYVIAYGMTHNGWSAVGANCYRRPWSSFYKWAHEEGLIEKNPMVSVKKVKEEKHVRQPFSEEEMERLRAVNKPLRDRALLECLFSTAARVSELSNLKRSDLDLENDCAKVMGKGRKERTVYFNTKSSFWLKRYLATRKDDNPYVFVSLIGKITTKTGRLNCSGIEIKCREWGKTAGITNVHPHRFRHTAATMALRRGMPIEQVRMMLGHESIETTLIYAKTNDYSLKENHKKFMS